MPNHLVIIGWSVAGASLCRALAMLNYRGDVTVIDGDTAAPYDRPPLSKEYLWPAGGEVVALERTESWQGGAFRTITGRMVQHLDHVRGIVTLDDGTDVNFDELIVATGARARVPAWAQSVHPLTLRSAPDARRLREMLASRRRLLVIGGGFIGSEVAAAAAQWSAPVTVIDPLSSPMGRLLGARLAEHLAAQQHQHGIDTLYGHTVEQLTREHGDGTVTALLAEGAKRTGDEVLVAVGAAPNSELFTGIDGALDEHGYVHCDENGRVRGLSNVCAVGDVATWFNIVHQSYMPSGHWTSAVEQANHIARRLCRPDTAGDYAPIEYFWTDQFGQRYQAVGRIPAEGPVRHIGPATDGSFGSVWYDDATGHMTALAAVGFARQIMLGRRAIERHQTVDEFLAAMSL